jgi:hypothetical protein
MQAVAQFNDALDVDYWKHQHPGSPAPEWTTEHLLTAMELISAQEVRQSLLFILMRNRVVG